MSKLMVSWDPPVKEKFDQMISKIPVFLRSIAAEKVGQKIAALSQRNDPAVVTERDMVEAFFAETPFGFHGPLKTDMESLDINYAQYGF